MNDIVKINLKGTSSESNLVLLNEITEKKDVRLTPKQAEELVLHQNRVLVDCGRIRFYDLILEKILLNFYDSVFIDKYNYFDTLCLMVESFYNIKNETENLIGDDELISFMRKVFDEKANGSVSYMEDIILQGV